MRRALNAAEILTALPLDDADDEYDLRAIYDLIGDAVVPVEFEGDRFAVDVSAIVDPLMLVAIAAVELCASRSGSTRAETIFDLRNILADDG